MLYFDPFVIVYISSALFCHFILQDSRGAGAGVRSVPVTTGKVVCPRRVALQLVNICNSVVLILVFLSEHFSYLHWSNI